MRAARRTPGDRDPVWVAAIFGDVFFGPGQRLFDVDDVIGPGGARTEPVVDRHAHPTKLGEVAHQRISLLPFASHHPRAAGNLQQDRRPSARVQVRPSPDIEVVARTVIAVADVRVVCVVAVDPHHANHTGRLGRARARRPLPEIGGLDATIGAQPGVERRGQRHVGLVAEAVEAQQTHPRQRRHQPTEPAQPWRKPPGYRCQRRKLCGDHLQGQL